MILLKLILVDINKFDVSRYIVGKSIDKLGILYLLVYYNKLVNK